MPYTPTTWVEDVTTLGPTNLNHLEEGVDDAAAVADAAIPKATVTTAGDLIRATGNATVERLPAGAAGTLLVGGAAPAFSALPYAAYTPELAASVSNPTLGSGSSVAGRYVEIGKHVHAYGAIFFGSSGTDAGSGTYRITLPKDAAVTIPSSPLGQVWLEGTASALQIAIARLDGSNVGFFVMGYPGTWPAGTATHVSESVPYSWGANMVLRWAVSYEGS